MTDAKTLNLTSLVSKKTRRAKARLLQNFGKADKTTDELFEVYQLNFNRQQGTALNLQKQVKNYVQCLKDLHEASKGMSQCLLEMHERDWPKHDTFENNAYEVEHANEDLEEKLKESVLVPLEEYLGQFMEVRDKIAKRGRKLVDYDSQRHTYEALVQHQAGKQADDSKLSKSRDQLDEARRVYESLNNELHEELPALYDNRLAFIITVFQRLFASHISYYTENLTVNKSYLDTVEQLARATEKGGFTSSSSSTGSCMVSQPSKVSATGAPASTKSSSGGDYNNSKSAISSSNNNNKSSPANNHPATTTTTNKEQLNEQAAANGSNKESKSSVATAGEPDAGQAQPKAAVLLHKVRATYKYLAEDDDELSFDAGEIIQVIEYDDPQEQEEGWLMGVKESTGQRGLFPANFTKEL